MKKVFFGIVTIQSLVIVGFVYFTFEKNKEIERQKYEMEKALEMKDQELRNKMEEMEAMHSDLMRLHDEVEECSRNGFHRE